MTSLYINGDFSSGYTLPANYSGLIISPTTTIGGTGLVTPGVATVTNKGVITPSPSNDGVQMSQGGQFYNTLAGLVTGAAGIYAPSGFAVPSDWVEMLP